MKQLNDSQTYRLQLPNLDPQEIEVMCLIRHYDGISRKALAEMMSVSQATMTKLSKGLLDQGYIIEGERISQGLGRKEVLLQINPSKFRYLGIDIGGYRFRMAIADNQLRIIHEAECLISEFETEVNPLRRFIERVDEFLSSAGMTAADIDAIGVGVTGIVDEFYRRILNVPNVLSWESLDIADVFESHYACPVYLDESGRVMALAEKLYGQAREMKDFIVVNIGYGVVAGIVIHGEPLRGYQNVAGLFGHITVDEQSGRCRCGNYGCLEDQVTFPIIEHKYLRRAEDKKSRIVDACRINDKTAIDVCIESGKAIGVALSNTVNLFNPQSIFIGGPVFEHLPLVLEETKRTILLRANRYATVNLQLLSVSYGERQGIMGALALAANSLQGL